MRGMPFQFQQQGKGVLEIIAPSICDWNHKKEEELFINNSFVSNEPTSVLHMRRSPSPPTSASTLSSSFNGGGGGNTTPLLQETSPVGPEPDTAAARSSKDEWACELQSIPSGGLEAVTGSGGERCGGLGLEDWETMLSETAASPGQDHSLLRWISGDVDDASFGLKQLLQSGNNSHSLELDGNVGLGIVDQGSGFDHIGSSVSGPNLGFSGGTGFNGGNGRLGFVSGTSGPLNYKVSNVGMVNNNGASSNPIFTNSTLPVSLPHGMVYQNHQQFENPDEKPQILNPQLYMNQHQSQLPHQNPNFFMPVTYAQQEQHFLQSQPKRHNPGGGGGLDPSSQIHQKVQYSDPGHEFLLRKQHLQQQPQPHFGNFPPGMQFLPQQHHTQPRPVVVPKQKVDGEEMAAAVAHQNQQQQLLQHSLLDQLYKAAEMVGTGNFSHAQAILARLNHQLSPVGKPLQRAAFYFKEALQLLLLMNNPATSPPPRTPTPFDVIFKMGAYKVFSEVSPLIQFVNFTCNQALLEAVSEADQIHIVDFDIGFGAHWASFMQELPLRNRGGTSPSLKITAFASPSTHHTVELSLMRDNLTQFADEIGIGFELEVVNIDLLDQNSYSLPFFRANDNEAVAVNFPIWSSSNQPAALPNLLRFVKQLSPKIVVSLDRGCDRSDLPFPQHILQALQSYINLLESLDAVNVTSDAVNKIERFLLQPKIESTVLGRLRTPDKMPLWKTLFASAGFTPLSFSNFTETQAECVVKRSTARGFHVEKRQESLVLCWQRRELISASAWRC
ncbi:PREDICTED: scarecrow-like protein 6 [Fragaria vesca subsp. vesca]|uniref:scarecrow-like protein 6 n=1 Tax=Fragaria vesca subsp. vesca TaxID=101020 RepID=UPI0002C36D17|nr:PREDICTED: scarecrow-like protein 6 [Fragaria vesca subsp. vesca]